MLSAGGHKILKALWHRWQAVGLEQRFCGRQSPDSGGIPGAYLDPLIHDSAFENAALCVACEVRLSVHDNVEEALLIIDASWIPVWVLHVSVALRKCIFTQDA